MQKETVFSSSIVCVSILKLHYSFSEKETRACDRHHSEKFSFFRFQRKSRKTILF